MESSVARAQRKQQKPWSVSAGQRQAPWPHRPAVASGDRSIPPGKTGSLTVQDVVAVVEGLARQKVIRLTTEVEPDLAPVTADQPKLTQILYNLLSNAIKFTPEGGRVGVGIQRDGSPSGAGDGAPWLRITVTDTGVGIRPQDQARIFETFEQVDSAYTRRQGGTGLGLALTRRLVELHGGRIRVDSDGVEGRGSVFTVLLPSERPGQPAEVGPS